MKLASVVVPSVVAGALVLTLGACGSKASNSSGDAGANSNQSAATETKKAEPASDSKIAVTIDGVTQASDYNGNPCVIVNFTFTNVSDEDATSFMASTNVDVFQVQQGYQLKDNSDIEVNVYPLISFDDKKPLAQQTFSLS